MLINLRSKGIVFILSAPSGGGKTSLTRGLLEKDNKLKLSISATTRKPRKGEIEGVDYFFKTEEEFKLLIKNDLFLEYAQIYNNFYGTPKNLIEEALNNTIDILFDIDWQGAQSIKKKLQMQTVSIFLMPPSFEILKERLIRRNQNTEEEINYRLHEAVEEMKHAYEYDYIIINEDYNLTLKQIQGIIFAERVRTSRLNKINIESYEKNF